MVVTLGQQYNVVEKPTVLLYTYINRHAESPNTTQHKNNSAIEPYKNGGLGQQQIGGERNIVILYNYIDRQARTPNKTKTEDTLSLNYNTLCCIISRNGWVSMKEISTSILKNNENAPRPSEHLPVRGKMFQNV